MWDTVLSFQALIKLITMWTLCVWLGHIGIIRWLWRGHISKYGPMSFEIGVQYGPTAEGRRSVLDPNFEGLRSVFTDMSEPESLYSHCNTLKVVFSLFLVQAYLINRNRSVLENTDLFSVSESRSLFSNTDLFPQLSKTLSKSSKISANTWSYVCIGNQLKCITMGNTWGVDLEIFKV